MKQANIRLKLSQGHDIGKKNITPIEALVLVSLHHQNAGGNPVTVIPGTEHDIPEVEVETIEPAIAEVKSPDGKTVLSPASPEKVVKRKVGRTEDQELDRLRSIYGPAKVKNLLSEVKNLPTTFKDAIERGTKLQLGSSGMISQTKLM